VARYAPAALVAALLVASAAAFAYTERLKLTPSPILGTRVVSGQVFSPTCECATDTARFSFRLRRRDRVTATIVDRAGKVVRTLVTDLRRPRGPMVLSWDGRGDGGEVVPDGAYRPRIKLAINRRTILLPNPVVVDTTSPTASIVSVRPRLFSPDGDGRSDRVTVTYRVDEPARGILYVGGTRVVVTYRRPLVGSISWNGKVAGKLLPPGPYRLTVGGLDVAGNLGAPSSPVSVVIRYLVLGRTEITVAPGRRFAVRVSTDVSRIAWRLGARSGSAPAGTLRLRAPKRAGRYTLTVSAHGHLARAAVIVRVGA
jgi:hypothetical protein